MEGKRVLLNLLLVAVCFFSICVAQCSFNLKDVATRFFGPNLPGLEHLLQAKKSGDLFELYSGVYVQGNLSKHVIGFDLEIRFLDNKIKIPCERGHQWLRTTEFDVVTEDVVIESKSSINPDLYSKEYIEQFLKERTMLRWLDLVVREYDTGSLKIDYDLSHRGSAVNFMLRGLSTCERNIEVSCSWVDVHSGQDYIEQFISIARMLSKKTLVVFFSNFVSESLKGKLEDNHIAYCDGIGGMVDTEG